MTYGAFSLRFDQRPDQRIAVDDVGGRGHVLVPVVERGEETERGQLGVSHPADEEDQGHGARHAAVIAASASLHYANRKLSRNPVFLSRGQDISHTGPQPGFKVWWDKNTVSGGHGCFYCTFKTNFSGYNTISGGTKMFGGALPPNAHRGYGPEATTTCFVETKVIQS